MTEDEAVAEERRIAGLLEENPVGYEYRTAVLRDPEIDFFVGVGWYAAVGEREFGNVLAVAHPGFPIDMLRLMIDRNYTATMASLEV